MSQLVVMLVGTAVCVWERKVYGRSLDLPLSFAVNLKLIFFFKLASPVLHAASDAVAG